MRNTPPPPRRVRSAHESKSATVRAAAAAPSRRQHSKWQREQQQQRTLFIAIGVLAVLVAAIFAGGIYFENVVRANEVVAQIGPDTITASQLVDEMRPRMRSIEAQVKEFGGGSQMTQYVENQKRSMPDQTLNDLIDLHLIAQEAARRGVSLGPSEVDDKVRQTVAEFEAATNPAPTPEPTSVPEPASSAESTAVATPSAVASPSPVSSPTSLPTLEGAAYTSALQKLLERNSLTETDLRQNLEHGLLRDKVQTAIQDEVPATEEQVHARHILVASEAQANDVLAQLRGGSDFAQLAQQVSLDTGSKDKGGDLGWFGRGVMDKPFEAAAFELQPGQLSDVVHGAFGYHVIEVLERDANRAFPADQLQQQRQKAFNDWLASRRSSPEVKLQLSQSVRDWALSRIGVRP
jgi:parvulin-like peptidyl-prolyl isomerase